MVGIGNRLLELQRFAIGFVLLHALKSTEGILVAGLPGIDLHSLNSFIQFVQGFQQKDRIVFRPLVSREMADFPYIQYTNSDCFCQ